MIQSKIQIQGNSYYLYQLQILLKTAEFLIIICLKMPKYAIIHLKLKTCKNMQKYVICSKTSKYAKICNIKLKLVQGGNGK